MGGGAALFEWQGGNVWRVVRGGDAVFGGDCKAAASGGDLPDRNGFELSRWVDVSGRSVRTVVQRIVVDGIGGEHDAAARGREQRAGGDEDFAVGGFRGAGGAFGGGDCAVF